MTAIYDTRLVILSLSIAVFASYTALNFVSQITVTRNRSRWHWFAGGAIAIGIGIWSTHFILVTGEILLEGGADVMQYSGITAMKLDVTAHYNLLIVAASTLFAFCASVLSLWLAFHAQIAMLLISNLRIVISSVIMGIAICGMHYTAMEAVSFYPTHSLGEVPTYKIDAFSLATLIGVSTLIVLILALIGFYVAKQVSLKLVAKAKALQASEERFRSLFQNISNIIATIAADGQVTYISPSITQILGYSSETWLNQNIVELVHPDDRSAAEDLLCCTFYNPLLDFKADFRLRDSGGRWRNFEAIAKNLLDEPNVAGIVITCRDITEQKQAEADIQNALNKERELNELKSRFISMASHEFRTPLSVISSSIGILKDYGNRLTEEQRHRQFQCLHKSIDNMTQLLDDVLMLNRVDLGKLESKPTPLNIVQFCLDLVEEMQLSSPQYSIHLSINECEPDYIVLLDEKLLRRILTNLLSNAIKYSQPGSKIHFRLVCHQESISFQVQDTGIGIPEEDQQLIFESFHRAKNVGHISGTGLGLSIVKRCVALHGGEVIVKSHIGVGTTFTITLPLKSVNPQDSDRENESVQVSIAA